MRRWLSYLRLSSGTGASGLSPSCRAHSKEGIEVRIVERRYDIHIHGHPRRPMQIDCQASGEEIPDAVLVQAAEQIEVEHGTSLD
jgi:hypothetical protein